jgi:hypothetical protein
MGVCYGEEKKIVHPQHLSNRKNEGGQSKQWPNDDGGYVLLVGSLAEKKEKKRAL